MVRFSRRGRRSAFISTGVLGLALMLAWFIAAPLPLKGQNSYLITSGTSMLPDIKRGDLVITRKARDYQVGDVVAYRDPTIGAVLHRIIATEGDRFMLQGDNNDFIDPYQPERSEIMGKMEVHVPGVGRWLAKAYEPRNAAMLAVAGGLVLTVPAGSRQVQQSRRRHGRPDGSSTSPGAPKRPGRFSFGPVSQMVGMAAGCLALAGIILAVLAYSVPLERQKAVPLEYQHMGVFSYTSEVDGTVYPSGMATTGEPVYRQLADEIAVQLDYDLVSGLAVDGNGTYRLDAVIRQDDGWSRSLTVVEETAFTGASVTIDGVLDLDAIQDEVDSARAQTGLDSQPLKAYMVDVVSRIDVEGVVGGLPVAESFAPSLTLKFEPLVVTVAASARAEDSSPFLHELQGTVVEERQVANSIALPGYALDVSLARSLAQVGMVASIALGLVLLVAVAIASGGDEPARIKARYGALMVSLRGVDLGDDGRLIEVESIDDLVKVAEREGRMILHREYGSVHQYFVQDVDVTYRYQSQPAATSARRPGVERAL